jgi:hypothetical protein
MWEPRRLETYGPPGPSTGIALPFIFTKLYSVTEDNNRHDSSLSQPWFVKPSNPLTGESPLVYSPWLPNEYIRSRSRAQTDDAPSRGSTGPSEDDSRSEEATETEGGRDLRGRKWQKDAENSNEEFHDFYSSFNMNIIAVKLKRGKVIGARSTDCSDKKYIVTWRLKSE